MTKADCLSSALTENKATEDVANPFLKQPRHVAIIMEGNGRWARERSLSSCSSTSTGRFSHQILERALQEYRTRERRFGGLAAQAT